MIWERRSQPTRKDAPDGEFIAARGGESGRASRGDFYQRHFIKITNGTGNSQRGGAHSQHHKATCVHFLLRAPQIEFQSLGHVHIPWEKELLPARDWSLQSSTDPQGYRLCCDEKKETNSLTRPSLQYSFSLADDRPLANGGKIKPSMPFQFPCPKKGKRSALPWPKFSLSLHKLSMELERARGDLVL